MMGGEGQGDLHGNKAKNRMFLREKSHEEKSMRKQRKLHTVLR